MCAVPVSGWGAGSWGLQQPMHGPYTRWAALPSSAPSPDAASRPGPRSACACMASAGRGVKLRKRRKVQ